MKKTGSKGRWDYKHPDQSYASMFELPSGNIINGVAFLKKNLIVRVCDLFGKNGRDQKIRTNNLTGHAEQINNRLIELYRIDEFNYGSFESILAQKLIKVAKETDLEDIPQFFINFNFKMTSIRISRKHGEKISIEWWGYAGQIEK